MSELRDKRYYGFLWLLLRRKCVCELREARVGRWMRNIGLPIALIVMVMTFRSGWLFQRPYGIVVIGTAWAVPMFGFVAGLMLMERGAKRLREIVRPNHYLICTGCLYPLRNLPKGGHCPECGTAYHFDDLPRVWENAFGADIMARGEWRQRIREGVRVWPMPDAAYREKPRNQDSKKKTRSDRSDGEK